MENGMEHFLTPHELQYAIYLHNVVVIFLPMIQMRMDI